MTLLVRKMKTQRRVKRSSSHQEKSVRRNSYLARASILSFSFPIPQLIGLGRLVMCGAYTATIPSGSRLSVYRLLAGVYYATGRCQGKGRERAYEMTLGLGGGNILTSYSYLQ